MKLTKQAIQQIIDTMNLRIKIALENECSERTVLNNALKNIHNSFLTNTATVRLIAKETGLKQSEILTDQRK